MSEKKYDCLCAGVIVSDHVCEPIEYMPVEGELILSPQMHLTIGGCAANVAADVAKLQNRAAVLGCIGQDIFGEHVKSELTKQGVICDHLAESATVQTAATLIVNVKNQDRRFIHTVGANGEFTGKEITRELIAQSRILYVGGYLLPPSLIQGNVIEIFSMARELGVTTVLDVVTPEQRNYWDEIKELLAVTDYFLPNDDEAKLLTGLDDPIEQARKLRSAGAKTVVVTCGSEGTVVLSEAEEFRTDCFNVPFVDGTGSGDAFVAGFMDGLLAGKTLLDCVTSGSALGASCVQATGATEGVFNKDELATFLEQNQLQARPLS